MKRDQLIIPIESMLPRNFLAWLFTTILPTTLATAIALSTQEGQEKLDELTNDENATILNDLKALFLKVYGFDGYNPTTNLITSADGTVAEYQSFNLPWWIIITSLLGLPNRPSTIVNGEPQFSLLQFWRNFIGGWKSMGFFISSKLSTEMKILQMFALPFKFLLILPIKIISIPFKILLNIVKLVTEILFPIILNIILMLSLIPTGLTYGLSLWTTENYWRAFLTAIPIVLLAVISIALTIVQYATIWACRIGFAFTSPAESARLAFALGRTLRIGEEGSLLQRSISNIVGVLGTLASLALSAVLWSIALPFALSALTTLFPFILTGINWVAQIPFIANSLYWISQLPVVTSSTVLLNQLFATVGAGLSTVFGPIITFMAGIVSVQVPTAVLAVGTTLGMLCTPILALMNLGAEALSNFWVTTSTPIGEFIGLLQKRQNPRNHPHPRDYPFTKDKDILHFYHSYDENNNLFFVISPFALELVSRNKHLTSKGVRHGEEAEKIFNDIKTEPDKQWNELRYRFPNDAELGTLSEVNELDQSSNDLF